MKKILCALFLLPLVHLSAAPISLSDCYGCWRNDIYTFSFNRNYTATIVIGINQNECIVFSGVFNVEKDNLVRVNISEFKQCPRGMAFVKSGFSRTASSHFILALDPRADKRTLVIRPKEIIIDANSSEGYFDQEMALRKN